MGVPYLLVFLSVAGLFHLVVRAFVDEGLRSQAGPGSETLADPVREALGIGPREVTGFCVFFGGLFCGLSLWVVRSYAIAAALFFVGCMAPRVIVGYVRRKRMQKVNAQLVDALELLRNSLRCGLDLTRAVSLLTTQIPPPLAAEFAILERERFLGKSEEEAFQGLSRRVPSDDVSLLVTAILTARRVGGRLTEVFERIAHTIRERRRVQDKLEALTAQGKLQGIVVGSMPLLLMGILYVIDPSLIGPVLTEPLGNLLLAVILILDLLGALTMRWMLRIEI